MSASEFRSNADARLRAEVAACSRILVMENLLDYSGHVSARVPGEEAYYIQAGADPRSELDPNRLIKVDFEGNVVGGANLKPPIEIPIHGEIYKARPDVNAVLHCHMDLAIAFTLMEDVQLMPMRSRAIRWQSGIPTNPDPSHIRTKEQGKRLADDLGPHHAALMRAHGMVLVAESIPAILGDAVHFDENARAQMQVMQAGCKPKPLTAEEIKMCNATEVRDFHNDKLWRYYQRKGERGGVIPHDWQLV